MVSASPRYGSPSRRRYATSKGGLKTLTNALAVELGPLGIRVNAVRAARLCSTVRAWPCADAPSPPVAQVLPAATNTPMLRAGFEGNAAGARTAALHRSQLFV
jgi:NAD(P)-dependent dehydrogenase (short-subunit alcohol dehydrogenase family)